MKPESSLPNDESADNSVESGSEPTKDEKTTEEILEEFDEAVGEHFIGEQ